MDINMISIKALKPAEYNPRKITRDELGQLKKSIKEFGMVDPIIVNADLTVIGGHQRLRACEELRWETVPCVVLDLTKEKEKALNIALNRIGGEFDDAKLKALLTELAGMEDIDVHITGFDEEELRKLMSDVSAPPKIEEWGLDEVTFPFWIVIRGPMDKVDVIKRALSQVKDKSITVEESI